MPLFAANEKSTSRTEHPGQLVFNVLTPLMLIIALKNLTG